MWINKISFDKKWYYEACPKCNKRVDAGKLCQVCEFPCDYPDRKFILPVELIDQSGSLTATAFDEAALCFVG